LENKLRAVIKKPIKMLTNNDLKLNIMCTGLRGSPTVVAKTEFIAKIPRKKEILKDKSPQETAAWLLSKLKEEGFLN
ncbi:MAG: hypothetical protein QW338_02530, partial [Conexivisphaerales archaeon]